MKKLLVFIAAVSFTAVTFAQSAQTTQSAPAVKAETKKECSKDKDKACCKRMKADDKAESKAKASDVKVAAAPKN